MYADQAWLVAHVRWTDAPARDRGDRPESTALYQRLLPWHDQFATTPITAAGRVELDPESRSDLNARSGRVHGSSGHSPSRAGRGHTNVTSWVVSLLDA